MVCTDKECKELEYKITDANVNQAIQNSNFAKDPTDPNAPNLGNDDKKKTVKEILAGMKTRTKCDAGCRCIIFPAKSTESEPFDVEEDGIKVVITKGGQPHKYVVDLKAKVTLKETMGICVPAKGLKLAMLDPSGEQRPEYAVAVMIGKQAKAAKKR
jgi:hypothetical protein